MARLALWILTACLALVAGGCNDFEGETILSWDDPGTHAHVEVKYKQHGSDMRIHMQVKRDGREQRLVLTDRADVHLATLLHYNDWILVLSGPYVLGGYDIVADKIVAANSAALPFTLRTASGYPVDEKRIADGDDPEPFGFVARKDRD